MKSTALLLLLLLLAAKSRAALLNATCVCAGVHHSCLVSSVGKTVCWGNGGYGRLGYGSTTPYLSPLAALAANPGGVHATPGNVVTFVEIVCGRDFTLALLANGEARGWGHSLYGELGLGHTQSVGDDELPWQAPGGPVTLSGPARDLCCSGWHCCVVMDTPNLGKVACWGNSGSGRLGYGNTNWIGDNESVASAGFVDMGGSGTATAIFCGGAYTLVLMSDGALRSWGYNSEGTLFPLSPLLTRSLTDLFTGHGQLGLGHMNNIGDDELPSTQADIAIGLGASTIYSVGAGRYHSCIVSDAGRGKCWGRGENGRLGTGGTSNVNDPTAVGFLDFGPGELVVQLQALNEHTCAVLFSGAVKCFGLGIRLGCGWACPDRLAPNETVALSSAVSSLSVDCVAEHTIAVHRDSLLQAWGLNDYGQLGYGDTNDVGDDEIPADVGKVNFSDGVSCGLPLHDTQTATAPSVTATEESKSDTRASLTITTASKSATASESVTEPSLCDSATAATIAVSASRAATCAQSLSSHPAATSVTVTQPTSLPLLPSSSVAAADSSTVHWTVVTLVLIIMVAAVVCVLLTGATALLRWRLVAGRHDRHPQQGAKEVPAVVELATTLTHPKPEVTEYAALDAVAKDAESSNSSEGEVVYAALCTF